MLLKIIGHEHMVERGTIGIAGQQFICIQAGDTVKRLYFAGRIFRELAFIRGIKFRRKLIHHHAIRIFM